MYWTSVKSGLRQLYVGAAAFILIGLLDMLTTLHVPAGTKYAIIISAALAIVKMFDKAIRAALTQWIESRKETTQ